MNQGDVETLQAMVRHVRGIPAAQLSRFWSAYGARNVQMLRQHGIENFKRTVNQNYFNWIPVSDADNQYRRVRAYWEAHPDPGAPGVELEDWQLLEVGLEHGNPFGDARKRACYARFLGMLWHHVRHREPNGILDRLSEPELGNPIRARLGGRLISQDLANSVKERNALLEGWDPAPDPARRPVVGELGAGYGRLGYVLAQEAIRYVVIDVPPALLVSQWYLSRALPGRRVFAFRPFGAFDEVAAELRAADLAFLTPDQFELLPDGYFDAFATISTLAEMTRPQVARYLELIARKTRARVYVKQWREWTNPVDRLTLRQADYDLAPGWRKRMERVDSVQDLFFETLWESER
jgi:putative sugar O-methyltransferase